MSWVIKVHVQGQEWYVKRIKRDLNFECCSHLSAAKVYQERRYFEKLLSKLDELNTPYQVIKLSPE